MLLGSFRAMQILCLTMQKDTWPHLAATSHTASWSGCQRQWRILEKQLGQAAWSCIDLAAWREERMGCQAL